MGWLFGDGDRELRERLDDVFEAHEEGGLEGDDLRPYWDRHEEAKGNASTLGRFLWGGLRWVS